MSIVTNKSYAYADIFFAVCSVIQSVFRKCVSIPFILGNLFFIPYMSKNYPIYFDFILFKLIVYIYIFEKL